jgi:RNA polymerase sigma-70 factor (ECF subfamily)
VNDTEKRQKTLIGTVPIDVSVQHETHDANGPWGEIIRGCLSGSRSAQEKLYKQLYGKMMAMGMRYLADKEDALEAVNTGFLKVFQRLDQYTGQGAFEGWVYSIVRNSVIDHLRSRVRYKESESVDVAVEYGIPQNALQDLYVKDLMKMLNVLPETTRLVFNMFALEGYKHEEIGEILGISSGTSKWHVSEARRILKQQILEATAESRDEADLKNRKP